MILGTCSFFLVGKFEHEAFFSSSISRIGREKNEKKKKKFQFSRPPQSSLLLFFLLKLKLVFFYLGKKISFDMKDPGNIYMVYLVIFLF